MKVTEDHQKRTFHLINLINAYGEDIGNYFKKYPILFLFSLLSLSGREKIQKLLQTLENESTEINDEQDKQNFLLNMAIDEELYRLFKDEIQKFIHKEILAGVQ